MERLRDTVRAPFITLYVVVRGALRLLWAERWAQAVALAFAILCVLTIAVGA